jgi:hypothetical protein
MHDWVLWILAATVPLHVVEEAALGWQGWAAGWMGPRIGMVPRWMDFWPTNGYAVIFAISAAAIGWRAPAYALALPAALLIDVILFHVLPSVLSRRPNPGCFSGLALYVPISIWCYAAAADDHVLDVGTLVLSVALGALLMASVIAPLVLQRRFRYPDVPAPKPS